MQRPITEAQFLQLKKYQSPLRIIETSDKTAEFLVGDYFDYFTKHPERLAGMPGLTVKTLHPSDQDYLKRTDPTQIIVDAKTVLNDEAYPRYDEVRAITTNDQAYELFAHYFGWRDDAVRILATEIGRDKSAPATVIASVEPHETRVALPPTGKIVGI